MHVRAISSGLRVLLRVLCALFITVPLTAAAAPPDETPAPPDPAPVPEPEPQPEPEPKPEPEPEPEPEPSSKEEERSGPESEPLRQRARHIRSLIDGTLGVEIDARSLFALDLTDSVWTAEAGARFARVLERIRADPPPPPRRRRPPPVPELDALSPERALETALGEFLALGAERRAALVAAHDARRTEAAIENELDEAQALQVQAQADLLRAYLTGRLDLSIDPSTLTRFNLLDADVPPEDTKRAVARADLELQRRRFLALAPQERTELAEVHAARIAAAEAEVVAETQRKAQEEAAADESAGEDSEPDGAQVELEEAKAEKERAAAEKRAASEVLTDAEAQAEKKAAERRAAERAAREANTEALRTLGEERARLLGIQEEQANHEAALAKRRVVRADDHDRVLDWNLRVATLGDSPKFESEIAAEADPMYREIREDLDVLRGRLEADLERLRSAGTDVPGVGEPLDGNLPTNVDRGDIPELRGQVARKEDELNKLAKEISWELASQTRDDVVALNRSRLRLLDLASAGLRKAVTSFGSEGVDQVRREFKQISLEVGYFLQSLPRFRVTFFDELVNSTVAVIIALLKLTALVVAFAWWRRRGTEILQKLETFLRSRRPMTRPMRFAVSAVWYLRRIRRPLVVLAVIWGLLYVIEDVRGIPDLSLVWIASAWILLGLASVLLVDAIAARETLYTASKRDNSALRIHSLRVVAANVVAVGMVLSLSAEMVGRGAIYSWVFSTCWILSFPVAIYLVHRWKPIIFELVEERLEQSAFTRWVTAQRSGVSSFPAATVGAAYLLGKGSGTWIMRQLSGLEVTRRLLAYLFRRELAKQAAATEADGRYRPIGKKVRAHFDPELLPDPLVEEIAAPDLKRVTELLHRGPGTLTAIVGERGSGKSVFIRRLRDAIDDIAVHCVGCPEEGIGGLMRAFGELTGNRNAVGDELAKSVRGLGRAVIIIDDVQRLVIPAVNGLKGLDELVAFSRKVDGGISWVVTIGSAAWQYILRARGERVSFEQVLHLPRWSEDALGELIKAQCEKAGIDPSFDGLVVPRQNEPLPDQGDRTEASYYRLLWDFSKGNPAVALHAFRESLFKDESGACVVRLFKEPSPEEIEALSLTQLFVLRTIVQLELALPAEVARATQIALPDVEDAMRYCEARGYVEPYQGGVRLSWPWYRTVTTVLQRQHLLSDL